jgi:two-component system, NarL family, response regulator LiaR
MLLKSDVPAITLLIVEDDPLMLLGLEQFLENYPQIKVIGQATDGYSAIAKATQLQPDLILMDIGLPQLDGIAATQQIKQAHPQQRVIMLTSHTAETETLAALASGADAYCVKGTHLEQLMVAIASVYEGAIYLDPQVARRVFNYYLPQPLSSQISPQTELHSDLTEREIQVLQLIVEGRTNPEIAEQLHLSLSTVKTHIRSVMTKLAVDDRVQVAVVALRSGLVK